MPNSNRPPPPTDHYASMFDFGSSLPPGALLPSVPGYSPVLGAQQLQSPARMSSNVNNGHGHDNMSPGARMGDFDPYNHGRTHPSTTMPSRSSTGASETEYGNHLTREMRGALPVAPPPPPPPRTREGSVRRALPKIPGQAEGLYQPRPPAPVLAPAPVVAPIPPPAPAPTASSTSGSRNAPPMPPPRSIPTRRALPTPPTALPPVSKPSISAHTHDSPPGSLRNLGASQHDVALPPTQHEHQRHASPRMPRDSDAPSLRQVLDASSTYDTGASHNRSDWYFDPASTVPTSVPSHSTQRYVNGSNHTSNAQSGSHVDDNLAYDSKLDITGQQIGVMGENEDLSSTPKAHSWVRGFDPKRLAPSSSVNSLQTQAAATPSPIPSPVPAPLAFPDARPVSEGRATLGVPSSHPNILGRKDLYDELGVDESDWGGQNYDYSTQYEPIASSSSAYAEPRPNGMPRAEPSGQRNPARWYQSKLDIHEANGGGEFYEDDEYATSDDDDGADDEMNGLRFFNPAYLSETAVQVRDRVIRGTHIKGGTTYVGSFTGTDLVYAIGTLQPPFTRDGPADRRFALQTAKSLQSQLWVVEADWVPRPIRDSPDDVFKFMSDLDGMGEDVSLPKGVLTMATKCYSSSCNGKGGCYSPRCPYTRSPNSFLTVVVEDEPGPSRQPMAVVKNDKDWMEDVPATQRALMSEDEQTRQTLIRKAIIEEERYEANLGLIEQTFLIPLQTASPPIVQPYGTLDQYVRGLFSNIVEIRQASRALLENFAIRLREQGPLVQNVGDIFLDSASQFETLYSPYIDNLPKADTLLNKLIEENLPFSHWLQAVSSTTERRLDLRYLLKHPASHLQCYPQIIQGILDKTPPESPDCDFLKEALGSIQNISYISRLKLFQASLGRDPHGKLEWNEVVSPTVLKTMSSKECRLQHNIWELIKTEMQYVYDLQLIDKIFITPLRMSDKEIIERSRLEVFIDDVFHNYKSILAVHEKLLADLHDRQLKQHPKVGMVSDLMLNAYLNGNEAYAEYMPHYPIAKAKIDEEKSKNPNFAAFLQEARSHPAAVQRHDLNHYIYRPLPRFPRYNMLLSEIMKQKQAVLEEKGLSADTDSDIADIGQVIDLIAGLTRAADKGIAVNEARVSLWEWNTNLNGGKFGHRAARDLELLNPMRELIHEGKVFRQSDNSIGGSWTELQLLLFDNYLVQVKVTKSKAGSSLRYTIKERPIPLELLKLGNFDDQAITRSMGMLTMIGGKGHNDSKDHAQSDSKTVYPFKFSVIGAGASNGVYTLWADSKQSRSLWHDKLKHGQVLRTEINEANKVFEFTPLSLDTFYVAPLYGVHPHAQQNYTGRVTCSAPFVTADHRKLVAIGCEQGLWIGVQHDPSSLRKVLHVKAVTQIAILEEFGIVLVLADKSLLAYHLEALVPTASSPQVKAAPHRLSGVRDIVFFAVGQIADRTLVLYAKRKGITSVLRALEPVLNRAPEDRRRLGGFLSQKNTDWFRLYREFFIATEAMNVQFLKAKIVIVCAKGFEVMNLSDLKGGSIPVFDAAKTKDRPELAELQRRCELATSKPIAMFRSTEREFLLCYEAFGFYVDQHGLPNRSCQAIDWEGKAENIVFHPPYLLLISPSFIEVRHINTAKLLQIYTGVDIRCTWDGTGGMIRRQETGPDSKGWGDEVQSTEPRIHICKRTTDNKQTNGIEQQVYELTPTLLLNNPLLNPVHTQDPNYFPPAPLDYRSSGGEPLYWSEGYEGDSYVMDRQSVSSVSTTTYVNQNDGTSQTHLMSATQHGAMHPHQTLSIPAGFEMPMVRDDYEYFERGTYPQVATQQHLSNEWPAQSAEVINGYGGGGYQPQYGQQQQRNSQSGPSNYAQFSQAGEFGGYQSQQQFAGDYDFNPEYQQQGYQR
ncbi:hypothetical protein CcaverHIS631_0603440 [Cutaneotrichosporon cavernicola]|nr:hypothetical protein CcaverHIS631_0603440 [Cutaneotrichosporon cavernicola]BEJ09430.1 hypothetical protein CcaverHIS641_0603450 [Cutaneotrichosporon cavernicola]